MRRLLPLLVSSAVLSLGLLAFTAGEARADEAAPAAAPAVAPAGPAAPGADKPGASAGDEKEQDRLRIGFNFLNAGVGSAGDLSGPVIGATFKIGWQLNRLMGVYGNITPFVWVGSSSAASVAGQDVSIGAITGTQFTPLFSLTPVDLLEIAAGPSADYLTGGGATVNGNSAGAGGFSSVYFGAHGKIALHLGSRNEETGRRRGFTIEANVHPSFTPDSTALFMTGGLGYDWH